MVWNFPIRGPEEFGFYPPKKFSEPMSRESFSACSSWLKQAGQAVDHAPDSTLLVTGLRQGRLLEAGVADCRCRYGEGVFFSVPDREPRFVTSAQFCVMRFLALSGGDCEWWFDRSTKTKLPDHEQRWYLRYTHSGGIWGLRILADAQPEEVVHQIKKRGDTNHLGHKDLRPSNLMIKSRRAVVAEGKRMRRSYRGRKEAIELALNGFRDGFPHLALTASEYAAILQQAFDVLDMRHGHEILR